MRAEDVLGSLRVRRIAGFDDLTLATLSGHGRSASTHSARRSRMMKKTPINPPHSRISEPSQ